MTCVVGHYVKKQLLMAWVNNMTQSQVSKMLEELTALQVKGFNESQLDAYRSGYFKTWLAHIISYDAGQLEILNKLIEKERNNVI